MWSADCLQHKYKIQITDKMVLNASIMEEARHIFHKTNTGNILSTTFGLSKLQLCFKLSRQINNVTTTEGLQI